ncbi:MAG: MBL fold metallo-hydrolase [Bdellovibrionales bacterium]|nr:MBL fold metallo-hydrolase [Bdellovibrionales bacterium]
MKKDLMDVQHFFDKDTSTLTYIVYDAKTRDAIIIDPVLDLDMSSGIVANKSLKSVVDFIKLHNLHPHFCLETHAHADHLSSAQLLKEYYPNIKIAISERIQKVQKTFKDIFHFDESFKTNGSQFDKLILDNEEFFAGSIKIKAIPTPGHTPACTSFHINNMLFTGDALFVEDGGTGRCDFPDGSAGDLYQSVHEELYSLPDNTIVFTGHDYQPGGRELRFETTIGVSKRHNSHLKSETKKDDYVKFRQDRDKTLSAPKLLYPSIQVNINAGVIPKELRVPLSQKLEKY